MGIAIMLGIMQVACWGLLACAICWVVLLILFTWA
jgi:hypothetical protein